MNDMISQFPTYKRELSSFERTIMAKIGWACAETFKQAPMALA